jgi:glycosyltransferase involved in cell wall biosynthesis
MAFNGLKMPKVKIAHIITMLELGGAQKTTLSLLRHMDKDRYGVYLITSPAGHLRQEALLIPGLNVFFVDTLARGINIFNDAASFFRIAWYLRRQGISIVHTHSSKAGVIGRWAAWYAGVKSIFHTVHGWPFYIETGIITKALYKILEKVTALITTALIVVSDADMEAGLSCVDKKKDKYVKISYGIESERFIINTAPVKGGDIVRVGFIACYKPQKAPLNFVKVARTVVNSNNGIEFISAGDGVLRPLAEEEASRLGLAEKIRFLGWQEDIPGLLSTFDILLLTSRWEGLPVVVLEAFASGVPVVATDAGGTRELVINGVNGFIEKKDALDRLAYDILLLANDRDKRLLFARRAREAFKKEFDIYFMKDSIQGLYEQAEGGQVA